MAERVCRAVSSGPPDENASITVIVFSAAGLQRLLRLYRDYYDRTRTHLSLNKDAPIPRRITPPSDGRVVAIPQVGGLHHRYERRAA